MDQDRTLQGMPGGLRGWCVPIAPCIERASSAEGWKEVLCAAGGWWFQGADSLQAETKLPHAKSRCPQSWLTLGSIIDAFYPAFQLEGVVLLEQSGLQTIPAALHPWLKCRLKGIPYRFSLGQAILFLNEGLPL